jgi:hypothetical protein
LPARSRTPAPAPTNAAPSGLGGFARWALALAAPAVPLAVVVLARIPVTAELQRLLLLLVVALVGVALGAAPAILTALVAVPLGWFRLDTARVTIVAADQPTLAAFAATALLVAITAGARRGASAEARALRQQLALATEDQAAHRQSVERLTAQSAAFRAEADRLADDLTDARAESERLKRSRKAILDSLPPDLRAPHVVAPRAIQLFPPLLTEAPLGTAEARTAEAGTADADTADRTSAAVSDSAVSAPAVSDSAVPDSARD